MMSCEGIWKVEVKGPYGWERMATAFMRNGEYWAASANHYSVGHYTENGDDLELSLDLTQYGDVRSVFGIKSPDKLQIISKGKIKKNKIVCTTRAKGVKNFDILMRLTRLDNIG
jgi:hypothetical protein